MAGAGLPVQLALVVGGFGFAFGALFAVAWRRFSVALRAVEDGPYRRVHVVGWVRPPDGCNLGLFWTAHMAVPDAVVRLPLTRDVNTTDGWVAGDITTSAGRAVAVFDERGEVVGAGRTVPAKSARRKWSRRHQRPSRWVMQPPGSWRPPQGD